MIDRYDALCLLGLALLCVGLWMIYPPAAVIVCGAVLLRMGLRGGSRQTAPARAESER